MFNIDQMSRTPVYLQIIEQVETFVLKDILKPNDQIPSVRNLSVSLALNPNTVQKAYSELDRRGLIYSVPGRGCFIASDAKDIINKLRRQRLTEFENITKDLLMAGISKNELIECIESIYKKGV
ncbi:MAG: GntR family transcriptional regulator [Lachnospiraceae bacterium]|nr:GntR family transcriptional regulator [Lachnospiraceae bacterium]